MSLNYLTPDGLKKLRDELKQLLHEERGKVVAQVSAAAALGDRSENADYIYGKRRLREIDRRIRFLHKRLENVELVEPTKIDASKATFGAWVSVQDDDGAVSMYQIVGPDEIDPASGRITFSSPLGIALLGKKVGDMVTVKRPLGTVELEIVAIAATRP